MANPQCHIELVVSDTNEKKALYEKAFNWSFNSNAPGSGFYMPIDMHPGPTGGFNKLLNMEDNLPKIAIPFFHVVSIDDKVSQLQQEGKVQILVEKKPHPGPLGGNYAIFKDPGGTTIGLHEDAQSSSS